MLATRPLILLALAGAAAQVVAQCTQVEDKCLLIIDANNDTHSDGQTLCRYLDGELVRITEARHMKNVIDFVLDYISGAPGYVTSYWVDGKRDISTNKFIFSDNNPVPEGTPFWAATPDEQEPSGAGDCINLNVDRSFYMTTVDCTRPLHTICEVPPPPALSPDAVKPAAGCTDDTNCTEPFECVGSQCLKLLYNEDSSWEGAEGLCKLLGGDLAVVDDIELLRAIYLHIQDNGFSPKSFWLAGFDMLNANEWNWIGGSPVPQGAPFWGLTTSYELEPTENNDKNCLGLQADGAHYFRSVDCNTLQYPLCMAAQTPSITTSPSSQTPSITTSSSTLDSTTTKDSNNQFF